MTRLQYIYVHSSLSIDELKAALRYSDIGIELMPATGLHVAKRVKAETPAFFKPQCGPLHD